MLPEHIDYALPPRSGFLRQYVEYASACSDAPQSYHLGVGLTILSGAMAKKLICPWMAGRALMPNLYTLLVGPSRSSRKTGSMDAGIDLLQSADETLVCPIPGSYEELVAQLRKKPEGVFTYREFAHLLKTTQKGYGEPIRTVLNDLFDWPPNRAYTRNLKKGATIIQPPICISLLGGIATDLLYAYVDTDEWSGGFFGRMLLLYAERTEFKMPLTWHAAQQQLIGTLHSYIHWPVGGCGGFAPEAWNGFEEWARWRDGQGSKLPPRVQTFNAGTTTLTAKLALLLAADAGEPSAGVGWLVSAASVKRAIYFVENLYLPSISFLGEHLATGVWERDRQRVLDAIEAHPLGITRRQLLLRVKLPLNTLDDIISALKEDGSVAQGSVSHGGITYRRSDPNAAPRTSPKPPSDNVVPFGTAVETPNY